ncbi:MAG: PSD1 and planctomycete cytochrome C domain-containing protein [Verrucomicrobiales bacterium]|nr:PSD1 and planctomycete cytochrome C domain-containing protein [Verrucomicrobiales bacterium]
MKPFFYLLTLLLFSASAHGAETPDAFFETRVRPLLAEKCFSCHGEEKAKGGLRLDHIDAILKGGESGPALVKGDPENSLLIEAILRSDPDFSMPPKDSDALTEARITDLKKWITMGAPWPESKNFTEVERDENGFSAEDRNWWAVQPVTDPEVPADSGSEWARNPIDHFVARKLTENRLQPAPEATPLELVRRIYFDLHGLPPLPAQVDAFVEACQLNPDEALKNLIDELLASPRYGERWGQSWLDVVRYAESDGYNQDAYRPGAKNYRNYVIQSFNEDKPYTQFVREQLAGDIIDPDNPDVLIGTSFLRQGIYEYNLNNARMQWDIIMTDMTNVTGEAFLGLSVGCAQCHDHKFDPILQKDYFALQAFLSTTSWPTDMPLATAAQKAEFAKQEKIWEEATGEIREELEALKFDRLESQRKKEVAMFPEDIQAMVHKSPDAREPFEEQMVQLVQRQIDENSSRIDFAKSFKDKPEKLKQWEALNKKLETFAHLKPKPLPIGFVATDVSSRPVTPVIKKRDKEIPVEPAFLTLLGQPAPEFKPTKTTTGRRLALADWIASPENPLSTRVITNRIWQGHFGTGLVATPNDFGNLGEAPSHPELLDWLTIQFVEGGWKMKDLHRLILTSATYRMTARKEPTSTESQTDPSNRLLWRFPPRRLSSEEVRDAMLVTSGEIRYSKSAHPESVSGSAPDRSIYVKKLRNKPDALLNSFDSPLGFQSTASRPETTTPTQSLMLINNTWPMDRAKAFAKSLRFNEDGDREEKIISAYQRALSRPPNEKEINNAIALIDSLRTTRDDVKKSPEIDQKTLAPNSEKFAAVKEIDLGEEALRLKRGSSNQQLEIDLPLDRGTDEFTIEAVTELDSIYPDGTVNTLVSRWDENRSNPGWFLCVTSTKSRYQPRNLLFVMNGVDQKGAPRYEVAVSDLRVPVGKPVYIAAAVTASPVSKGSGFGEVTFFLKDLSDPKSKLESVTIIHSVVGKLNDSPFPVVLGGRRQVGHFWDGQVSRLTLSHSALTRKQLLLNPEAAGPERIADWKFSGTLPPNANWYGQNHANPLLDSAADFCHLLFNSNEFLYLY